MKSQSQEIIGISDLMNAIESLGLIWSWRTVKNASLFFFNGLLKRIKDYLYSGSSLTLVDNLAWFIFKDLRFENERNRIKIFITHNYKFMTLIKTTEIYLLVTVNVNSTS